MAPARQAPPKPVEAPVEAPAKVQQVEVGERGEGQRLDNFLGRMLKDIPKTHVFRVMRKGEVRGTASAPTRSKVAGKRHRGVPPVRTGAAAPPRRAPPAMVQGLVGAIVYGVPRLLVIDKPAGAPCTAEACELRGHRGACVARPDRRSS